MPFFKNVLTSLLHNFRTFTFAHAL